MRIEFLPTFEDCPRNPARCYVPTGDIEINLERWRELNEHERRFVLLHEEGHFANQSFDETVADDYALQRMALRQPYSLENHIRAVREVSYNNPKRVRNAIFKTLQIAAQDGSLEAKRLLVQFTANADGSCSKTKLSLIGIGTILTIALIIKTFKS